MWSWRFAVVSGAFGLLGACNVVLGITAGTPGGDGGSAAGGGAGAVGGGGASAGGGGTGGEPACAWAPDGFDAAFDWTYGVNSGEVPSDLPATLALAEGHVWLAAQLTSGTPVVAGTAVTSTGDGLEDAMLAELDATGQLLRGFAFGGVGAAIIERILPLPSGELLLAGTFSGELVFGASLLTLTATTPADANWYSAYDAFLARFDPGTEKITWAKGYGDGYYQAVYDAAVDTSGSVYVVAGNRGVVDWGNGPSADQLGHHLVKLDAAGNELWRREMATGHDAPARIALRGDGDLVVIASATDSATVFGGVDATETTAFGSDVFVAAYDPSGSWQWHRLFGGDEPQWPTALGFGPSGDVYVAGLFQLDVNEHGDVPLVTGAGVGYEQDDIFFARLAASDGKTAWMKKIAGPGYQVANALEVDCAERVTLGGSIKGADGNPGTPGVDFGDGVRLLGTATDEANGYRDPFLATYAASGELLAVKRWVQDYQGSLDAMVLGPWGGLVFAGTYWDSLTLSPAPQGSLFRNQNWDFYLASFQLQ